MKLGQRHLHNNNNMLKAGNVAIRAQISRARLYQLIQSNNGPPIGVLYRGVAYYDVDAVDAWIKKRDIHVELNTYLPPTQKVRFIRNRIEMFKHTRTVQFYEMIQATKSRYVYSSDILEHMIHLGIVDFLAKAAM